MDLEKRLVCIWNKGEKFEEQVIPSGILQVTMSKLYPSKDYYFLSYPLEHIDEKELKIPIISRENIWIPVINTYHISNINRNFYRKCIPIQKILGSGTYGMAFIWSSDACKRYKTLAIPKYLAMKYSNVYELLIYEYSLLKLLENVKNILPVYGFESMIKPETDVKDSIVYMKYLSNSFFSSCQNNKEEGKKKIWFTKICKAIKEIHKRGVIHRDLSIDNIMLDENEEPYIIDFGLGAYYHLSKWTPVNHCVVTYPYRAPEVFCKKLIYDETIDIWSLGVLFIEIMTNECIFYTKNVSNTFMSIMKHFNIKFGRNTYSTYIILEYLLKEKEINKSMIEFGKFILRLYPKDRPSIDSILSHPYLNNNEIKEEIKEIKKLKTIPFSILKKEEYQIWWKRKSRMIQWFYKILTKERVPLIWMQLVSCLFDHYIFYLSQNNFPKTKADAYIMMASILYLFSLDHFYIISLPQWVDILKVEKNINCTVKQLYEIGFTIYNKFDGNIFYDIPLTIVNISTYSHLHRCEEISHGFYCDLSSDAFEESKNNEKDKYKRLLSYFK